MFLPIQLGGKDIGKPKFNSGLSTFLGCCPTKRSPLNSLTHSCTVKLVENILKDGGYRSWSPGGVVVVVVVGVGGRISS